MGQDRKGGWTCSDLQCPAQGWVLRTLEINEVCRSQERLDAQSCSTKGNGVAGLRLDSLPLSEKEVSSSSVYKP
jgi:hypothetical protein